MVRLLAHISLLLAMFLVIIGNTGLLEECPCHHDIIFSSCLCEESGHASYLSNNELDVALYTGLTAELREHHCDHVIVNCGYFFPQSAGYSLPAPSFTLHEISSFYELSPDVFLAHCCKVIHPHAPPLNERALRVAGFGYKAPLLI